MQCLINGIPKYEVSVTNRGLQYGDGAFETLLAIDGRIVFFEQHLARLARACQLLQIPLNSEQIKAELTELCREANGRGVAKIIITRGAGGRGYKPKVDAESERILQYFDSPTEPQPNLEEGISITVCQHRLSKNNTLAGLKHLNRIDQVLASLELSDQFHEGLCLDADGYVVEGTKSNLLISNNGRVFTPDLSQCGVRGIMLTELRQGLQANGIHVEEKRLSVADVIDADEVLVCNSVLGISPVLKLHENGSVKHWSIGEFCRQAIQIKNDAFASS